jgi:type 1 fimbria pilin
MKKMAMTSTALLMTLSLVGCNTTNSMMNDANRFGGATVGTGMGFVANTGQAVGKGVGNVLGTTTGWIMGKPASQNGSRYVLKHGKYVRVQ